MLSKDILLAIRPQDLSLVPLIERLDFKISVCHTLNEALENVNGNIELIVCCVHFDQGAMFDFLRTVKSDPATQDIPFFLVFGDTSRYSEASIKGIYQVANLLGADGFFDLGKTKTALGIEEMCERLISVMK